MSVSELLKKLFGPSNPSKTPISGYITVSELVTLLCRNGPPFSTQSLRAFACSLQLKPEQTQDLERMTGELIMNGSTSTPYLEAMLKSTLQAWKSTKGKNARMGVVKGALKKLRLEPLRRICERYKDNDVVVFDRSENMSNVYKFALTWKPVSGDNNMSTNGRLEELEDSGNSLFETQSMTIIIGNVQENPFVCEHSVIEKMVHHYCSHDLVVARVRRVGVPEKNSDGVVKPRPMEVVVEPNYECDISSPIGKLASDLIERMGSDREFRESGFTVALEGGLADPI